MACFNIRDFGAAGDAQANDGPAIQAAIDACHAAGGGMVVVPAGGVYRSGSFRLKSFVNFHIEGGARIIGSERKEDYPNEALRCLIEADGAECIALTGQGTLDGRAKLFMTQELPHIYRGNVWRPRLIGLLRCRNVTVRDLTLKDSANWGLHLAGCEDVVIHGLRIRFDLKVPNCDGIDPDHCRNVRISDCYVEAGDDCIVIKCSPQFAELGPSENITVTGCILKSTSAALKIGTESFGDFRNIIFDSCVVRSSSRGLAIQLRDHGNIENVIFSNMIVETRQFHDDWWGDAEPIYVTAINRAAGAKLGRIRNVRFRNILCRGENGVFISGCPDSAPEGIVLEDVRVEVDKWSKWPGGKHDRRPCAGPGIVEHRTAGFYVERARDVTLRHCRVRWGQTRPEYFGHALEAHRVEGLVLEDFQGDAAHPQRDPATVINDRV